MSEGGMSGIGYCGMPCSACYAGIGVIASKAKELMGLVNVYSYEWLEDEYGYDFGEFMRVLGWIAEESPCPGCRKGGGAPCESRPCARERGIEVCFECGEFPCPKLNHIVTRYPYLTDLQREYMEMGREAWLAELRRRIDAGFHICSHLINPDSFD